MSNLTNTALTAIIFLMFVSCTPSGTMEQEPNNLLNQSNQIEIDKEISGYINTVNDIDNFVLSVKEDQILRISLSAIKGVNHAVKIWRTDKSGPVLIKIIDDNRKSSPEEFSNLFVYQGIYVISVLHGERDIKKASTDSKYRLTVSARPFSNEEKEPNDSPENGNVIEDSIPIEGFFSPAQNRMNKNPDNMYREEDWYSFRAVLSEGKPVLADITLSGVSGIDSILKVYDASMNELALSDNSAIGGSETVSDLGIKKPGIYYAAVSAKNYQFNQNERYEISLKIKDFDETREFENNNSFDTANTVTGNEITGKINPSGDSDFYFFSPRGNATHHRIELINPQSINTSIAVYNEKREILLEVNNAPAGEGETIPALKNSGPLFIAVKSISGSDAGETYNLRVVPLELRGNFETEPNDDINSANTLSTEIQGFTNKSGDKDYFLIRTNSRQKMKITARGTETARIKVSTTDPLGYIISTREVRGTEEISFQEMFNRKGYIIVETDKADFYNPYKIKIEAVK